MQHLGATNPDKFQLPNYIFSLNETHNLIGFMEVRHPFLGFSSYFKEKQEKYNWCIAEQFISLRKFILWKIFRTIIIQISKL